MANEGTVTVKQTKLANNLMLLGEVNTNAKSCSLGFFVKAGARDEEPAEAGISHFLEHMMFKGTPKRSSLDITYEMGNIGAQANAYTSEEQTVYYSGILPEYFATMQELLSDMLRPSLDPLEFNMEKKVILEEIALYKDRPHFFLSENATTDYFSGHPAGNSVLGTTESVGALTRDDMARYFNRRYSPSNMVLVASGNFSWEQFVSDTERYSNSWTDYEAPRKRPEFKFEPVKKSYTKKDLNQSHILLVTPGPGIQDDERYPLGVLAVILGDSAGSRLYWDLIAPGLAESASADVDERDGVGTFSLFATTEHAQLTKVSDILYRAVSKPLDFTDADLERSKTKILSRIVLSGELPMGRLMSLGSEWLARERVHSLQSVIARVKSVNRAQISAALERFPLKEWSEFKLLP